MQRRIINNLTLIKGAIIGVIAGFTFASLSFADPNASPSIPASSNKPPAVSVKPDFGFETAIENVAQNVGATVVAIRTERTEHPRYRRSPFGSPFEDEFFNRFFEDFFGDQFSQEYKSAGLGSGVIIDPKGYILTNEHVIGGADKILVRLSDGREAKGILTGTDPRGDLAVVKIDLADLPSAPLGDSDHLKTGQWVVAIGNPFGHILSNPEPTVTVGVISALQRSLPRTSRRDTDYTDLIQTDAAINPGNSGGPLVNLNGEIIGINVAIFSTSGGYQGVGFAIPISHAKRIIDQLIKGKEVAYGWIGVAAQDLNRRLTEYFGLNSTAGVLVTGVLDDSPAQKAGIQNGDIILSVDGKSIKNTASLIRIIGDSQVGKKASVKILRTEKNLELPVMIEKRPAFDEEGRIVQRQEPQGEEPEEESPGNGEEEPESMPPSGMGGTNPMNSNSAEGMQRWRGLVVGNIPGVAGTLENINHGKGVVVFEIAENSPAEATGLRKGDIITAINQQPVQNMNDFLRVTKSAQGNCLIQTIRGFFVIKPK